MDKEENNIIETTEVVSTEETTQNEVENNDKKGLSIASMILGIVSILLGRNFLIAVACGVLAIIFGLKGKKNGRKRNGKSRIYYRNNRNKFAIAFNTNWNNVRISTNWNNRNNDLLKD